MNKQPCIKIQNYILVLSKIEFVGEIINFHSQKMIYFTIGMGAQVLQINYGNQQECEFDRQKVLTEIGYTDG